MKTKKLNFFERFLNFFENVGNKMPDPVTLSFILCILVIIISKFVATTGISAIHPKSGETLLAVDLLTKTGFQKIFTSIISNFQGFPPLGVVLVTMFGAGVAEKTGFMEELLKVTTVKIPKPLVTACILFIGILANAAGDAGFIILPPLAAIIFISLKRHPLVGMLAAYAGVAAGFAANIFISISDVLAATFTIPAAQILDKNYTGTVAMNFYFLFVSTFVLVITGVFVTEKIIAPRFEGVEYDYHDEKIKDALDEDTRKKALKYSLISLGIFSVIVILLCIGDNAFFRDPETGSLTSSSSILMKSIVLLVTLAFFIPGVIYGIIVKKIRTDKDLVHLMGQSMSDMGLYIVLAFASAQFLAFFNESNLASIFSIKGAEGLKNLGISGIPLMILFIILSSVINLFIGSASAKWAIMAPIFVPMFMLLGYNPALIQMAYRIGDSVTNPLSPLFPYFPILLAVARKYDKKAGLGTLISNMIPYSLFFGIVWTLLLILFIIFNIPLGPGAGIHYSF